VDWTEPGTEEVAPGVHRIPLPMPNDGLRAVNVYAILGPAGVVLIDGGWRVAAAADALNDALSGLGLTAAEVGRCLVTHHHRDHLSLAVQLRRESGVRLGLGAGERGNLEIARSITYEPLATQLRLLAAAGAEPLVKQLTGDGSHSVDPVDYEDPDDWLADAQVVEAADRRLRVVSTPGHTRGHVVYVDDAADLMFTGDHVLPHITPSIGFEADQAPSPLADYLASLARTLAEPDRLMLPAHGPAGGSVHARTVELLEHHETRLSRTRAAVRDGAATAYQAARALRWTRRGRHLDELDPLNQMLAVIETAAHLQVLHAQGRIGRRTEGAVAVWSP